VVAPSIAQGTADHVEQGQGVDADESSIDISQAIFSASSRVIKMRTIQTTFLVDENLVPIRIEKIPGNDVF